MPAVHQPQYEVHVPPSDSDVPAASTSVCEVVKNLDSVVSHIPSGTLDPVVDIMSACDPKVLNPRTAISTIGEYINKALPLFHLHFVLAADATLISVSWGHVAMDGLGCGHIVTAWEEELNGLPAAAIYDDPDPATLFDFTNDIYVDPKWTRPGWIRLTTWDFAKFFAFYLYESYWYPRVDGQIFITKALVDHWQKNAKKELPANEWVSRNDLVLAWAMKYAWTYFPENEILVMFNSICLRGRHPQLPQSVITNTATSYTTPPLTNLEIRNKSLTQLALTIRQSVNVFTDTDYVGKVLAVEHRRVKANNGGIDWFPMGSLKAQHFGTVSWAKIGLSSVKFGKELSTVATTTYSTRRQCATVIDSEEGDFRLEAKLPTQAWKLMQVQMEIEKQNLKV
ncbi:hypothetical protein AJ80_06894 [Polytolypa hystricis UAMH7299]|uniref:Uncharacterized protein n=1 Tax=Polytolypa hystricis (strain UAMH7299) TaxID=1447883 RepID=A0A2B7XRZ4_POLH7|nr:hypothetical protein AJ80_06894 [Polytolypa hystricis UAMH7299]